jgi:hypothetical protein
MLRRRLGTSSFATSVTEPSSSSAWWACRALLVRNGTPVDEPYSSVERGIGSPDVRPLTLGADEFFVLGDNRGNSNDSRAQGPLARDQIYGRVEFIYFSTAGGGVAWERFPVVLGAD